MKYLRYLILPIVTLLFNSCADDSQTIDNVKEAATIVRNETIHYDFFAKQAAADSLFDVQKLFVALSKSADAQSTLFNKELSNLGVKNFQTPTYQHTVDSTLSNLYKAHSSAQYDYYNLFPLFSEQALKDDKQSTAKLFNQILIVKESNIRLLDNAVNMLLAPSLVDSTSNILNLVVCSYCGYISQDENCKICQ